MRDLAQISGSHAWFHLRITLTTLKKFKCLGPHRLMKAETLGLGPDCVHILKALQMMLMGSQA